MYALKYYFSYWYVRIITYLFIFFSVVVILSFIPLNYDNITNSQEINRIIAYLFNFLIILLPILVIERLSGVCFLKAYGLINFHKFFQYLTYSLISITILFSIVMATNYFLGNCSVNLSSFHLDLTLFANIVVILIIASQEELTFRAFLINSLELRFSSSTSVIVSSIVFASLHIFNTNFTYISALNTFLGGLLLGLMYVRSKTLWLPIMFHFFWNLLQPILLNSPISGINIDIAIFAIDQNKFLYFINGGEYGFEGTILASLVLVLIILYFSRIETLNPYNSSYKFRMKHRIDRYLLDYENK